MATVTNLVTNPVPTAVAATTGWSGTNTTLSRLPGYLRATLTTATAAAGAQGVTATDRTFIGLYGGTVVRATAQARWTAAAGMALQIVWTSSNGTVVQTDTGPVVTAGADWTTVPEVVGTSPAPSGGSYATVSLVHADTGARVVGDTIDFRRVMLVASPTPVSYFDGSFLPEVGVWYQWNGTALLSTSSRVTESAAGLPKVKVQLDDGTGSFPYDISAYVDLTEGVQLTRGRRDQASSIEASELRLTLNNSDGRFTVGNATYGVFLDQKIRLTYIVNLPNSTGTVYPTSYRRFTGYVQKWPVAWDGGPAVKANVTISATDELPRWERRRMQSAFQYWALFSMKSSGDVYWPLTEPSTVTQARSAYGAGSPMLTPQPGTQPPVFGATMYPDSTAETGMTSNTGTMVASLPAAAFPNNQPDFTIGGIVQTGVTAQTLLVERGVRTDSQLTLGIDASGRLTAVWKLEGSTTTVSVTHASVIADNVPHYFEARLTYSSGTVTLRLRTDRGTSASSSLSTSSTFTGTDPRQLFVTGSATYEHLFRVADHDFFAQGMTNSVTQAAQSGVVTASTSKVLSDAMAQPGTDIVPAGNTAGSMVYPLFGPDLFLSDVIGQITAAEPGLVYVVPDGRVRFQGRLDRPLAALQLLIPTEVADPSDGFGVEYDMDGVTNYRTAQRRTTGNDQAAVIVSRNDASIARHDRRESSGATDLALATDQQVQDRTDWEVAVAAEPRPRFPAMTVDLLTVGPHFQDNVLGNVDISARTRVVGMPAQSPVLGDLVVEGWTETVKSGSNADFTIAYNLTSFGYYQAWRLEDPEWGALDGNRLLF